jgi:hypothetical protein
MVAPPRRGLAPYETYCWHPTLSPWPPGPHLQGLDFGGGVPLAQVAQVLCDVSIYVGRQLRRLAATAARAAAAAAAGCKSARDTKPKASHGPCTREPAGCGKQRVSKPFHPVGCCLQAAGCCRRCCCCSSGKRLLTLRSRQLKHGQRAPPQLWRCWMQCSPCGRPPCLCPCCVPDQPGWAAAQRNMGVAVGLQVCCGVNKDGETARAPDCACLRNRKVRSSEEQAQNAMVGRCLTCMCCTGGFV